MKYYEELSKKELVSVIKSKIEENEKLWEKYRFWRSLKIDQFELTFLKFNLQNEEVIEKTVTNRNQLKPT